MNKFLFIFLLLVCGSARAQSDSVRLVSFLDRFLVSFRTLDWEPFYASFSDDATAYFPPSAKFPERANNKTEIGNIFRKVFEGVRAHAKGPMYLTIEPRDTKIQLFDGIAIVTFLLDDPGMLGRRTLVCRKTATGWMIIHLHASGMPTTPAS